MAPFSPLSLDALTMLQPEATRGAGGAEGGAPGGGGGGGACGAGPLETQLGIFLLMFAALYFLLIRPQSKRQKEHEAMLKSLGKGMVVRTTGGIRGEIVDHDETDVTLLVAEKTRIRVLRNNVATVEREDGSSGK
ncbi:MAG TPA: preprotein translocase subunit YajC [Polyangiaceae bacterium LLY-WYZ-14_1]|nr:preprotein translocase subunit YajC [Polyangiaceae bacterium LLY-WYZ-14_1]